MTFLTTKWLTNVNASSNSNANQNNVFHMHFSRENYYYDLLDYYDYDDYDYYHD